MTLGMASSNHTQEPPRDRDAVTLFALHFLGGHAGEWETLIGCMGTTPPWVAIDLPGFGAAQGASQYDVAAMAETVAAAVRHRRPQRWALVGHSMGAKVATVVARWAEDGAVGLDGLALVVLVAGSPPAPEPMEDDKRATMLRWFAGDVAARRAEADGYIGDNVGAALPPALHERTVDGVLRADRAAWTAWLTHGSREDWAERVGVLATPALIVAGSEDDALGADVQLRLTAPHFEHRQLVTLEGAGHLLPLERPAELADLIEAQLAALAPSAEPGIAPDYQELIRSDRVSARTRQVLEARAAPVPADPAPMSAADFATLRALVDRIVPQAPQPAPIDLAARITQSLRRGEGDGWRFTDLPPNAEACAAGLATLEALAAAQAGSSFQAMGAAGQDALLRQIAAGQAGSGASNPLSAAQMRLWFEDVCAAATRAYVAHPATLARIGYSGIANGGDGARKQGFVWLGPDEREGWEPVARADASR